MYTLGDTSMPAVFCDDCSLFRFIPRYINGLQILTYETHLPFLYSMTVTICTIPKSLQLLLLTKTKYLTQSHCSMCATRTHRKQTYVSKTKVYTTVCSPRIGLCSFSLHRAQCAQWMLGWLTLSISQWMISPAVKRAWRFTYLRWSSRP